MLELQWHPTAFFTGSREKTDNIGVSYLRWHMTSDLFHLIWQHPETTGWRLVFIARLPVFKETSNCSDQHLYNKSTVRVVVNAHRKHQYNRAAFFSFSSVNQTQKQHGGCWRIITTKAKSKASQPWLACALYLLVSSAAADALVSLIIMTGFITEKWYAVLAGKFELFMLLLNNRHE